MPFIFLGQYIQGGIEVMHRGKKAYITMVIIIGTVSLCGCKRESIQDVYNYELTEEETLSKTDEERNDEKIIRKDRTDNVFKHVYGQNINCVGRNTPVEIEFGTISKKMRFTVTLEEVSVADNIEQFSDIVDSACIEEFISDNRELSLVYGGLENCLNDDGTFVKDKMGINQVVLFAKINITNNMNEAFEFVSTNFNVYYFKKIDGFYYDVKISDGFSNMDKHDAHEVRRNHLTLNPGETKEVIMYDLIPAQLVTAYTRIDKYQDENYYSEYKDLTIDGTTLDSLYMCFTNTDKPYPSGSGIIRLEIEQ